MNKPLHESVTGGSVNPVNLSLMSCLKVYLRDLRISDAVQRYADWLNDPQVNQYLETRFMIQTVGSCRDFVKAINARADEHIFAICEAGSDQHVGNIKVGPINPYHGIADVSLFIGEKRCWGKGLATEAIKIISAYALAELKVRKLCAGAYEPNKGSTHSFLKAGYVIEGRRRAHFILPSGEAVDDVEVGLLSDDCDYIGELQSGVR